MIPCVIWRWWQVSMRSKHIIQYTRNLVLSSCQESGIECVLMCDVDRGCEFDIKKYFNKKFTSPRCLTCYRESWITKTKWQVQWTWNPYEILIISFGVQGACSNKILTILCTRTMAMMKLHENCVIWLNIFGHSCPHPRMNLVCSLKGHQLSKRIHSIKMQIS